MYESGWLSLFGLALEMLGLITLSYDLFRSRRLDDEGAQSAALQDTLEVSSRELVLNLNQHVDLMSDFFGKLMVVIAREGEFEQILRERPNLATEDPDKYVLIQDALDRGPNGLRRRYSETFLEKNRQLKSPEKIQEGLALNGERAKSISEGLDRTLRISRRLRRVAMAGVTLAAAGAVAQLADLIW
jgi:hypothetical protein